MISAGGTVGYARVRLSKLLMRGAYGGLGAAAVAFLLSLSFGDGSLAWVGLGIAATFALTIASYVVWFARGPRPGRVEADADSLVVVRGSRRRVIPRARIRSAAIVERPLGPTLLPHVEVDLIDGDRISVALPEGDAAARALVAELGFGPGARSVRLELGAPTRRLFHPLVGFAAYQIPSVASSVLIAIFEIPAIGLLAIPITIALYVACRRAIRAPVVTVGDDGLLWESGFKKRFVARGDIVSIEQLHQSAPLIVCTRSGGNITLAGAAIDPQRCTAVGRVVRERFARALGPSAMAAERAAYFARGSRTVADWRAAFSGPIEPSYRAPGASVEDMASVLTSTSATAEERVGAALALRVAGEPAGRIRVAAEAIASEPLREALAAAAEGDDAKLDAMLARIEGQR